MKHSIILSSYNRPRFVRYAIRSILQQQGDWELVITDDGSNEATIDVIREALGGDPRCCIIRSSEQPSLEERSRTAIKRMVERINDAILYCTGDLFHYLPDDDEFAPDRLVWFEEAMQDTRKNLVYGRLRFLDDGFRQGGDLFSGRPITDPVCALDHSQVVHRKSAFDVVPKWPTDPDVLGAAPDGVFFRTLCEAGLGPIWPMDHVVSYKRRHKFNLTSGALIGERRE